MIILQGNCREINFGNSLAQDFALAAKSVPMCRCSNESGSFAVGKIQNSWIP